jgi:uncharacterized membrane protein
MNIFKGYGDNFSWRKLMTGGALIAFMTSVMGYLITNNFNELPGSYQAIIAGVFVFYFGKDFIRGTQITTDNEANK